MATARTRIKTDCSDCRLDLTINAPRSIVTVVVPSNGRRGAGFVPRHEATAEVGGDEDLLTWDCPACGYADSFDLNS